VTFTMEIYSAYARRDHWLYTEVDKSSRDPKKVTIDIPEEAVRFFEESVASVKEPNAWVAFHQDELRRRYGVLLGERLPRGGEPIAVFALPALLCAAWTVLAGKDVNWDLLNYHYYLPYEWLHERLAQDYFAASGQSYLNPIGFLPFYAMLAAGWHSVVASMAL